MRETIFTLLVLSLSVPSFGEKLIIRRGLPHAQHKGTKALWMDTDLIPGFYHVKVNQILDDHLIAKHGNTLFWIEGLDTSRITDDDVLELGNPMTVMGSKQYTNLLGSTTTVTWLNVHPSDPEGVELAVQEMIDRSPLLGWRMNADEFTVKGPEGRVHQVPAYYVNRTHFCLELEVWQMPPTEQEKLLVDDKDARQASTLLYNRTMSAFDTYTPDALQAGSPFVVLVPFQFVTNADEYKSRPIEHPTREWTDETGKFTTNATYVAYNTKSGTLTILRNGPTKKEITLPLKRLSKDDREFVLDYVKRLNRKPRVDRFDPVLAQRRMQMAQARAKDRRARAAAGRASALQGLQGAKRRAGF